MALFAWRSGRGRTQRVGGRRRPAGRRDRDARGLAGEQLEPRLALTITLPIQDATGLTAAGYDVWVTGHGIPGWQAAGAPPLYLMSLGSDGSFAQTATAIQQVTSSGTAATVTTQAPHGLAPGVDVFIAGAGVPGYDGSYQVVTVPTATTFTFTTAASDLAGAGAQGTVYTSALIASTVIDSATSASFDASNKTGLATLTTATAHGLSAGQTVEISGVSVAGSVSNGYDGVFSVAQTPSATTFQVTYTAPAALGNGSGGTLKSVALEPVRLSQLPPAGITLDAGLTNISAKLLFFVTPATSVPNGLPFNGNGVTPTDPPTPPYGPSLLVPTSIFDIVEFAYLPWGATETGSVATITTTKPHGFSVNESITISGVVDSQGDLIPGYNQTVTVASVPTPQSFTFTAAAGLPDGGAGNVAGIPISGGFSTFDLSAVDGLAIPMTLTASQVKPGNVDSVGIRPESGFTRRAIGEAFTTFMASDPLGHVDPGNSASRNFSTLLYESRVTGPAIAGVSASWSGNVATFTYSSSTPILQFQWVEISGYTGDGAGFNGTYQVQAATSTSFTVTNTDSSLSSGSGGTVTPLVFQTPPLPDGQFASITAPKDWLGNQQPNATQVPPGLASQDPLSTFWDETIDNFFKSGNHLSIYLGKENPPNAIYSGSSDGTQFTLSNGLNTYHFPKPTGGSLANALYVWSQANAPGGDEGLLQDQIWQALCRGVALDGVSTSAITNAETTTAWNDTTNWYTQHASTAFPDFQSVYCPYSKFLHYSTLQGAVDTTGTTSIYLHNAAYGFGEDENPIGNPYTGPLVPSKLDGTVFDGSSVTIRLAPWTATVTRPAVDLNGDGIGDVIWHDETDGHYVGWIYDAAGNVTEQRYLGGSGGWTLEVVGYFASGPVSDLVWRETSSGANVLWMMTASGTPAVETILGGDADWRIEASGDYNGDGLTDVVWRYDPSVPDAQSGINVMWIMQGGERLQEDVIGGTSSWRLVPTAANYDANDDGRTDLIWNESATGGNLVHLMNGVQQLAVFQLFPPAGAVIAATGDFGQNGIGDLIWHWPSDGPTTPGRTDQWLMAFNAGTNTGSPAEITTIGSDPHHDPLQVASFWGDQLVWRNRTTGMNIVWQLIGAEAPADKQRPLGGDSVWRLLGRPGQR